MFRLSLLFIAFLSVGCVSMDPNYQRPDAPIPASLPGNHGEATAVVGNWQQVVNDVRLQKLVSQALSSNRDVQKAIADIDAARAQYGETRASLMPTANAELSNTRSRTLASGVSTTAQADGAVSSFELDLFGRNQSLSRAARETWLASEYTAQNTRLTMIAELTSAWVTLAADHGERRGFAENRPAPAAGWYRSGHRRQRSNERLSAGSRQRRQLSDAGDAG